MVRNYKRKTAPYNPEDMKKAVDLVVNGTMGYKKAAKLFNLKWETVRDHVKKKYNKMGAGRNTALSREEETELADCLKLLSRWGFGLTRKETQEVVGDYVRTLGHDSPFVDHVPGPDWLSGFLSRFKELIPRHPEQLKASRAKSSSNKTIFDDWFRLLRTTLEENDLIGRPERIYNVDESGFPLDPRRMKVITQRGIEHLYRVIGGSGRDTITVQGCARADGVMLPPYVLYAAKNLRTKWTEGGPENARYNVSDKGWMDTTCFHDWFMSQFVPFLPPPRPVVLIFDGHSSHLNVDTIRAAVENRIIILKLPPNTTHVLQPLDVGVYGPMKTAWEQILIRFARQQLGTPVTKELFPSLLKSLWESTCLSPDNIRSGFRKCGIMPCDQSQIPESVYASAEFFDRQAPELSLSSPPQPSTFAETSSPPQPSTSVEPSSPPQPSTSVEPSSPPQPSTFAETSSPLQPSTSTYLSSSPQPSTSAEPTQQLPSDSTPSPLQPVITGATDHTYSQSQTTIKDFFLKRLTPLMPKPKTNQNPISRQRAIRRQYGESLTSEECIKRLLREEEEKAAKKRPARRRLATSKRARKDAENTQPEPPASVVPDGDSDSITYSDSDNDPEWMPRRPTRPDRNVFDDFH